MRRRHLRRIDGRARDQVAQGIRFERSSSRGSTPTFRTETTIELILGDARRRYAWSVRGIVGRRSSCTIYSEGFSWNRAPMTFSGSAASGAEAAEDARAVEEILRRHFFELVLEPEPERIVTHA